MVGWIVGVKIERFSVRHAKILRGFEDMGPGCACFVFGLDVLARGVVF